MRSAPLAGKANWSTLCALDKTAWSGQRAGMTTNILAPEDCRTMIEVRAGVDPTDRELIALLERRFAYMRAAARIKRTRESVRDEARKAAVIAAARAEAARHGAPAGRIAALWDALVESSIAFELEEWERHHRL